MPQIFIVVVALAFAGMGIAGLVAPVWVLRLFGTTELTLDGRNEVRAVYGGFGLAAGGALLMAALWAPGLRDGVLVAFSLSLAGMAAGRIISLAIERKMGWFPTLVLLVELLLAGLLFAAFRLGDGG